MDESRPAGFWIRALALSIDFVLFAAVQFSFGFIAGRLWGAAIEQSWAFQFTVVTFTVIFTGAYTTVLHALVGQTLGKLVVGVRVVGADGEPPLLAAALLRYVAYYASLGTLLLGYLMAGLRQDKRALHDLIAGTRVERVPPRPSLAVEPAAPPVDQPAPPGIA